MTTPPQHKKKSSGSGWLAVVLLVGIAIWYFHKTPGPQPRPGPVSTPTTPRELIVGRWQARLASGAEEILSFDPLGPSGQGAVTREAFVQGKQVSGWRGTYGFRENPLLSAPDRMQITFAHVDPNWGRKEETLVLRSVSDTTLVLAGVYGDQVISYRKI